MNKSSRKQQVTFAAVALTYVAWLLMMSIAVLCIPGLAFFPGGIAMAMSYACAITIIVTVRNIS